MKKSMKPYGWPPPVSAAAKVSLSHLDRNLPPDSVEATCASVTNSTRNDVLFLPKIVGIYYAGRIYDGRGGLIQGYYSGVEDKFNLDFTDIVYAGMTADKNLMHGVLINNAPTLGDPWNSTPAWSFPNEGSDISPTPAGLFLEDPGEKWTDLIPWPDIRSRLIFLSYRDTSPADRH